MIRNFQLTNKTQMIETTHVSSEILDRKLNEKGVRICKSCEQELGECHEKKVFCSRKCWFQWIKFNRPSNVNCEECNIPFYALPSKLNGSGERSGPVKFCSKNCYSTALRKANNAANTMGRTLIPGVATNGYEMPPAGSKGYYTSAHQMMVFKFLGIQSIARGYVIHHRDGNKLHNELTNLVILTISDHRWLHEQAGIVGLKFYAEGILDAESMAIKSADPERFKRLIELSVLDQVEVKFPPLHNPELNTLYIDENTY